MKILVIGSGGREHALVWKLAQSRHAPQLYCAPGNAGIAELAERIDIAATDIEKLVHFAERQGIDLTVVGPEAPLCDGIVDRFQEAGLRVFGPTASAAALEGDKAFAKDVMAKHSIPTAAHRTFTDPEAALAYVEEAVDYPMVVKACGLASGKGVLICKNAEEARVAVESLMVERVFGDAADKVVIEDFLDGEEVSIIALTDGETICVFESAQDHKRAFDGDQGPNTGGMGAYSPAPIVDAALERRIEEEILVPIVHAMRHEKKAFRGVLFAGLMLTRKGPKVLEFNVRFGDPECQVLLARLDADLVDLLLAVIDGRLGDCEVGWDPRPAITVVVAQEGYPGPIGRGRVLKGVEKIDAEDVVVFHSGTGRDPKGQLVATGGRVLSVTALGETLAEARDRAYGALAQIDRNGFFWRRDVGHRALR